MQVNDYSLQMEIARQRRGLFEFVRGYFCSKKDPRVFAKNHSHFEKRKKWDEFQHRSSIPKLFNVKESQRDENSKSRIVSMPQIPQKTKHEFEL